MITVVVPVSPIKSHPSTAILDETLSSIRFWLPTVEVLVTFDGVRPEQAAKAADYELFIQEVLRKHRDVVPFLFDDHQHQTGMMRAVLPSVRTPLLLYVEQDTPLVTDEVIEWDVIEDFILAGKSNVVRLYHEAVIPTVHEHLMHGDDQGFVRTSQWSQRPHVASAAYYRRIMDAHFTPDSRAFIEDKMHSVVQEATKIDGVQGWMQHRVHLYNPGPNMKRSYHTDGRAGEPKWDDTQVF